MKEALRSDILLQLSNSKDKVFLAFAAENVSNIFAKS